MTKLNILIIIAQTVLSHGANMVILEQTIPGSQVEHFIPHWYIHCFVCLFVWYDSLRPINNLSVKQGWDFLVWTSTKLG